MNVLFVNDDFIFKFPSTQLIDVCFHTRIRYVVLHTAMIYSHTILDKLLVRAKKVLVYISKEALSSLGS